MNATRRRRRGRGDDRWPAHPVVSLLLRALVLVVPIVAGALLAGALARLVPRPSGARELAWWAALLLAATLGAMLADKVARRLLPLAVLLQLSLLFPDRAPSRFRIARAAGSPRRLHERIEEARRRGVEDDPAKAATSILELVAALSAHDRKTRGHSERVRAFTDLLAEAMKVPQEGRDRLRWAALLHDIGKLRVPTEVLNKPGKPDEREWELLKAHPLHGADLAAPLLPWLGEWGATIAEHHERFDGAGYPNGLAGEDICLGARIVTVADSFEVMTAARSYKRPLSPAAARRELARCAGTQFDPKVVRAMFNISLGRLRWVTGPAAWVAQLPFAGVLPRAGSEVVAALKGAAVAGVQALTATVVGLATIAGLSASADDGGPPPTPVVAEPSVVASPTVDASPRQRGGTTRGSDDGSTDDGGERPSDDPTREPSDDPTTDPVRDTVREVEDGVDDLGDAVDRTVDDTAKTVDDTVDTVGGALGGTVDAVEGTTRDLLG